MELTAAANEVVVQAQMLKMSGDSGELCVEHLFYGLLLLARYLDEPMDKAEFREEGKQVRAVLEKEMRSIESARVQLEKDAKGDSDLFQPAAKVVGRASELAEKRGGNVDASCFLTAILESPTPTIRALKGLMVRGMEHADDPYQGKGSPMPEKPGQSRKAQLKEDPMMTAQEPEPEPAPEPAEKKEQEKDSGISTTQLKMLAMLAVLANAHNSEVQDKPRQGGKRRTKMGLFTYPGGKVAAAVQYFLYGILVPLGIFVGVEYFLGAVSAPATPLAEFLVNLGILLWCFYLARGVTMLIGLANTSVAHFLDLLTDCAALQLLAETYAISFHAGVISLPWKIAVTAATLLVLILGVGMFSNLVVREKDPVKVKLGNLEGPMSMLWLRKVTAVLFPVVLILALCWIGVLRLPRFWQQTILLFYAFRGWVLGMDFWSCMLQRLEQRPGNRLFNFLMRFLCSQHVLLLVPGAVYLIHRLYDLFPMKGWVCVSLRVYAGFYILSSIANFVAAVRNSK